MPKSTLCSKEETTSHFKISSATLDNWIRTSIPNAFNNGLYDIHVISKFVNEHQKLSKRANKKSNSKKKVPSTLLSYLTSIDWIDSYVAYVENKSSEDIGQELIEVLQSRLNGDSSTSLLETILPYKDTYAFGVAYQIALSAGDQSQAGAYYTPRWLVQKIVKELASEDKSLLEPSCGVGFYLIEYIRYYKTTFGKYPKGLIFGNDLDLIASKITELSILLDTNNEFGEFIITASDGLKLDYVSCFDIVMTNPPYDIKNRYDGMKSTEVFGHFIHKCLTQYLKKDGLLDFILPEAILTVGKHQEIRQFILDSYNLKSVEILGKVFDGVFSDIVRIQIQNRFDNDNEIMMTEESGSVLVVSQETMRENGSLIVGMYADDLKFVQECYADPHVLLKDAIFAMGIVTGNNAEMVSSEKKDGWLPVITGKDIRMGEINYSKLKWISGDFDRFQQKSPMELFLKRKIVYKFISKDVDCAVDETEALLLNSANFIVLRDDGALKELGEQYVCEVLNSDRMKRLYRLKFGGVIKVLKGNLEELPIWTKK